MMKHETTMGMNRTGTASSPKQAKELHEASLRIKKPKLDGQAIVQVRQAYVNGGRIGSVPPPHTLRGIGKALADLLKGERAPVLADRLSERLCSERSAVRLYETLMAKFEVTGSWPGGPTKEDLGRLREEELHHFHILHGSLERMASDPTALTPSGDVVAVALSGVQQVIADPRTNFLESLQAMLIAELTDHANWELLVNLAGEMHREEILGHFQAALANEARHLSWLQSWVWAGVRTTAGVKSGVKEPVRQQGNGRRRRPPTRRQATKRPKQR